jgi:Xaa-Pro aminopeptidase
MNGQIIKERLTALRGSMKKNKIDALYIPTSDFHDSEYAGAYFRCREFFSGFTGSAGTLVVLQDQAGLWTDGRYFLQAREQLKDTGITLYKMGNEGVPTVKKFLEDVLKPGEVLGFDGRCVSCGQASGLAASMEKKGIRVCMEAELAGTVWEELGGRPQLSSAAVWELSECYAGKKREDKLRDVRKSMEEQGADVLLISSLDDIAWLLNLRGNDIPCVPVFFSYLLIEKEQARLYAMKQAFSEEIKEMLEQEDIFLFPYETVYDDLSKLGEEKKVWFDQLRTNAALVKKFPKACPVIKKQLSTVMMKAVKNEVEIENERMAHLYDGIAFCKFLYWLKHQDMETLTEISAAEKLEGFRKQQKHYIEPSFEPISAYAGHGAIVHYSATEESNAKLSGKNFLLMDTGAHYYEGSTDITRTIALGELTRKQKEHYTAVLRGNCNLGAAKFRYGCCGINLDILARSPLWEQGLDFNHGTGHGVGYLLNVHEAPNNIRMNARVKDSRTILEEGMITSNEPGLYLEGEYGIRLENLILCKKAEKTDFGQFMEFETLTLVPFEREAILPELMTGREKELLNHYHSLVFEKISPYLEKEEKEWLGEVTKAI